MTRHLLLTIHGKVQGVWFRVHAKKMADQLGVFGWVKNLSDGTVSVEVEGEIEKLERFIKWCREGSPGSEVGSVQEDWSGNVENYSLFEIK